MTINTVAAFVNLFFVGLLAGEEFVIRYGVRGPLASLDTIPHIQLRQALIRTLRILVPALFGATLLSGIAVTFIDGFTHSSILHIAGVLALIAFISITLSGTVPINQAVLAWEPAAPPMNWRSTIIRWEQLDNIRCWLAIAAFVCFLAAMAL